MFYQVIVNYNILEWGLGIALARRVRVNGCFWMSFYVFGFNG